MNNLLTYLFYMWLLHMAPFFICRHQYHRHQHHKHIFVKRPRGSVVRTHLLQLLPRVRLKGKLLKFSPLLPSINKFSLDNRSDMILQQRCTIHTKHTRTSGISVPGICFSIVELATCYIVNGLLLSSRWLNANSQKKKMVLSQIEIHGFTIEGNILCCTNSRTK